MTRNQRTLLHTDAYATVITLVSARQRKDREGMRLLLEDYMGRVMAKGLSREVGWTLLFSSLTDVALRWAQENADNLDEDLGDTLRDFCQEATVWATDVEMSCG